MRLKEYLKTIEKKSYLQAGVVLALLVVLTGNITLHHVCLGQNYFAITVNNKIVGNVSMDTDVDAVIRQCRRELAKNVDGYVCAAFQVEKIKENTFGAKILTDEELEEILVSEYQKSLETRVPAYTVCIQDFHASFQTLDEVGEFLDKVKSSYDTSQEFHTEFISDEDHEAETFTVALTKNNTKNTDSSITLGAKSDTADQVGEAGIVSAVSDALVYANAHPGENNYETGILDMGFTQDISVYSDYVLSEELTDVDTACTEVTKKEETNKIYEVEAGDCLSTIAENNNTTVEEILTLNGMTDANAYICVGDEIIISVPQPELSVWVKEGVVYEEEYTADPDIVGNDSWYTSEEVILQEGTTGYREVNMVVTYEDGTETERTLAHQTVLTASTPAVVERGTQIPPTYVKPINGGRFTSGFGKRWGRTHKGVDWACPVGTTVFASSEGVVEYADWSSGYGYNVIINHPDGRKTRYAHLSKTLVTAGQSVSQGQQIALSGNTGHSTGPHVHFEIFINGTQVNPLDYIN